METVEYVEKQKGDNPARRPLVTLDNNVISALRDSDPNDPAMQPERQLCALNRANVITLNVTLSTVQEQPRPGANLEWHEYATWLEEQGIAPNHVFTRPCTVGFYNTTSHTITFDHRLVTAFRRRIHEILFPNMPFIWDEYRDQECALRGITEKKREAFIELDHLGRYNPYFRPFPPLYLHAPAQFPTPSFDLLDQTEQEEVHFLRQKLYKTWRNKINDSLGFYCHLTQALYTTHPEQAVFVTNDKIFFKQTKAAAFRKLGIPGRILRSAEAVAFLCDITGVSLQALGVG